MAYKVDMSLRPEEILLGIINYENPRANLTFNKIRFSPKGVENADYKGRDSKIDLIGLPGSGIVGTIPIWYNRINLTTYLGSRGLRIDVAPFTETSELLDLILTQLGIRLTLADIMVDYINHTTGAGVIRISPRSLTYKGTISYAPVAVSTLASRIRNTALDGFYANSEVA